MPIRQRCKSCSSIHPRRQWQVYQKMCTACRKSTTLKRSAEVAEKKVAQHWPTRSTTPRCSDIDKMNTNSIDINFTTFNSKCSVITANLNMSSTQATLEVPYKMGSCVCLSFCCLILCTRTFSLLQNIVLLSKTSFQAHWALHQVWGQPNNNALICVAKLTWACLMLTRGCCKTLMGWCDVIWPTLCWTTRT